MKLLRKRVIPKIEKFYDNIVINSSRRRNSLKCMCLLTVKCQAWISRGFPCGSAGKEYTCNGGDLRLIPELGWSPGEGKGCPLQYSGLENTVDCIVHGVTKNHTQLSDFHWQIKGLQPCTENIQWQEHMQRSWCGIRIESSTETNSCLWPLGEMDMMGRTRSVKLVRERRWCFRGPSGAR